ncbi:hypothetical protein UFOVP37_5 [uncultured Caudovirales phage]|uniref:Uncharacterized protein n=1 Tax=uncultured Caudovirales phage TaxID=2100421 RepID=A0A6J5KQJ8_9CAUD|nr:hypothetical protein UFOVP37_5 [uncultured Caudovirales phage]
MTDNISDAGEIAIADVIAMAREAGCDEMFVQKTLIGIHFKTHALERFAELVRADERDACAKVCDDLAESFEQVRDFGPCAGAEHCADAIRAKLKEKNT